MEHNLVIIHGWGSSRKSWENFLNFASEIKNIRLHFIELPGFGQTPPPETAWTSDDYANYVFDFIKKKGLDKFVLFGHSFGGAVAIKFILSHPEYVEKLILCNAALVRWPLSFRQKLTIVFSKIGKFIFSLPLLNIFQELARKIWRKITGSQDYSLAKGVMRQTLLNVLKEDLRPFLKFIKTPTLIIWGDKDEDTPLTDGKLIHQNIFNSQMKIIKGANHIPYKTHIKELVSLIKNFLE